MADKRTPEGDQNSTSAEFATIPLSLYPEDLAIIKAAQKRGDGFDVRLDRSKTIRLLIRAADVAKLSKEQYVKAATEVSKRRKERKQGT